MREIEFFFFHTSGTMRISCQSQVVRATHQTSGMIVSPLPREEGASDDEGKTSDESSTEVLL